MNKLAYLKENIQVSERYELVHDRIAEIAGEHNEKIEENYQKYFKWEAEFLMSVNHLYEQVQYGDYDNFSMEELKDKQRVFYGELINGYEESFLNPQYTKKLFGMEMGQLISYLAASMRKCITAAMVQRLTDLVIYEELFVEIHHIFEDAREIYRDAKDAIYWFEHDYCEIFLTEEIRNLLDEEYSVYRYIVMEADLSSENYLYRYGKYISDNERKTAKLLASFSQEKIDACARTYTRGYQRGFELAGKDLSKKGTVEVRYPVGFERIVRAAVSQFEEMGLKTIIRMAGVGSTPANRQYQYDHKNDQGFYLDKAIVNRKLEVAKNAFEERKELAALMGGPAVIETFGETPFTPAAGENNITLGEKQQKEKVRYNREYLQIYYQYIKGEERSFTIIAYPMPEIGKDYEEIFEQTIRINNLDGEVYGKIQQKIIDALDCGTYVRVRGQKGNTTDMKVMLHKLEDRKTQTGFENCLADVNIPLGEVFTSPVLTGTQGRLNVSRVYLNDLKYENLTIDFENGQTKTYSCDNFENEEENQKYIRENLLYFHEKLPIGEFAIGTNTTAYVMANKYDIVYKMPILIVEKMGPHFALGDTCYSYEEDEKTCNPDGKEIIAKDNEISILRKEDASKAYLGCHTDITIPYDEIGEITVVCEDATEIQIMKNGRFVLFGTEELNKAFE